MKPCALLLLLMLNLVYSTMALACSLLPADESYVGASAASLRPAKNPPKGMIQLKIDTASREQIWQEYSFAGKLTLPVKKVLHGQFPNPTIRLNITNVDDCNSTFGTLEGEFYITVLPMVYFDGEPILDRQARQEFGATFYKDIFKPYFEKNEEPEFAEYHQNQSYSFYDLERLKCLYKNNKSNTDFTDESWRQCVKPGEYLRLDCDNSKAGKLVCQEDDESKNRPIELRRGYSFWKQNGAMTFLSLLTISVCLGIGYNLRKRKSAAS